MSNGKRKNIRKKKACLSLIITCSALLLKSADRRRRWWVKPWLERESTGNIHLPNEFKIHGDEQSFRNFLRMDEETFIKLLSKIKHRISKLSYTRVCISAEEKLIVTLRYLSTGESYRSLMYNYRISESTISLFIPEVCRVIYEELKDEYLKVPSTTTEWTEKSKQFENIWNMPNVVGALDGKHIVIKAPAEQGSAFYNYKGQHSIVLLALVDADYNFLYINVGMNGRISDGGIYWESDLSKAVEQNLWNLPADKPLPGRNVPVPHVIVADGAFSLSTHILKPYPMKGITRPKRIFNYRLSRARRIVESTFGILANRFRVLINVNPLSPDKVKVVTQACCVLHNFLKKELKLQYLELNPHTDKCRFIYVPDSAKPTKRPTYAAIKIREEFTEYVNGCGSVPWQDDSI